MPTSRLTLAYLLLTYAWAASAQEKPPTVKPPPKATSPAVACTSLANLRLILRKANDDPVAAVVVAAETKTDLNCGVLDQAAVTGIADHVALNGRAYDCIGVQNSGICHWTVAGSVTPPVAPASAPRGATAPPKARR